MTARVLILLLCVVLAHTSASAADLCVNASTGSDATAKASIDGSAQDGTGTCWATIGRAAWGSTNRASPNASEAATAGDTVYILGATYDYSGMLDDRFDAVYNPVNEGTSGNPITFRAVGTVTITAASTNSPVLGCYNRDYIIWTGPFLVDEDNIDTRFDTGPVVLTLSVGCQIIGMTINGITADWNDNHNGIRVEGSSDCVIQNNTIDGFRKDNDNHNGSGVTLYGSADCLIEHNVFTDSGSGIFFKDTGSTAEQSGHIVRYNWLSVDECFVWSHVTEGSTEGASHIYQNVGVGCEMGARFIGATDDVVANNTFYSFTNNGCFYMNSTGDTSGVRFYNNICMSSPYMVLMQSTTMPADTVADLEHNVYRSATTAFYNGTDGNRTFASYKAAYTDQDQDSPASIDSDPLFVDASGNDFRLCTGSGTPEAGCSGASPALALGVDILDLDGDTATDDAIPAGACVTGDEVIGLTTGGMSCASGQGGGGEPSAPVRLRIRGEHEQ